jgi:predicted phosphodiesterase
VTRVALLADIHGNAVALEAVLRELERQRIDQVIRLGDVFATGPQPQAVLASMRRLGCPVVMGNADAWCLAQPHTQCWPRRDHPALAGH